MPHDNPSPPRRLLVTGATGLVGRAFCTHMHAQGWRVTELSHRPREGALFWDIPSKRLDPALLEGFDAVVHLAGESIMGIWTAEKKRRIASSRIESTNLLANTLASLEHKPRVFVSASAVGYYPMNAGEVDESTPAGEHFLADVCSVWEAAADPAREAGIRTVHPRIAMVLSREGGALETMLPVFRAGVAGRLGSGKQGMSWITLEDLVGVLAFCVNDERMCGAVNASAPEVVTNAAFTRILAGLLNRPAILPAPAFVLKAALGDMARELLLNDLRVKPRKLLEAGYAFRYPELETALSALLESR